MAVTLTKEFWTNLVLFVVACVALGLSIWAFATPCKKDGFGNECEPIPPNCKGSTNPDCGSHGDKECPDGSLGYLEPCDPDDDKCCGYNVSPPFSAGNLTCKGDSTYCPSCR